MDAFPGRSAVVTEPVFSEKGKLAWASQFLRGEVDETDDPPSPILLRDFKPPRRVIEPRPLRPLREQDLDPWGIHVPLRSGVLRGQKTRYDELLDRFPSGTVKTPLEERDQNQTKLEVINASTVSPDSGLS